MLSMDYHSDFDIFLKNFNPGSLPDSKIRKTALEVKGQPAKA